MGVSEWHRCGHTLNWNRWACLSGTGVGSSLSGTGEDV